MVRMKDVAAKAGVSVFTVSCVINNSQKVSPITRDKVLKAIESLGYVPNPFARSLRTRRSGTIGVVVPFFQSANSRAFFGSVSEGIHEALKKNGFSLILSGISHVPGEEKKELINLVRKGIEGLIYAPLNCHKSLLESVNCPVVVIDRDLEGFCGDKVFNNNFESSFIAVDFLIKKGRRKIAYLGRLSMFSNHRERFEGYKEALRINKIPFDERLVKSPLWGSNELNGIDFGYTACNQVLSLQADAIFSNESFGTLGILQYVKKRGLRIPEDLALITYDDPEWCALVDPPLTAVRQPTYQMGRSATELLLDRIANPDMPPRKIILESTLIVREST